MTLETAELVKPKPIESEYLLGGEYRAPDIHEVHKINRIESYDLRVKSFLIYGLGIVGLYADPRELQQRIAVRRREETAIPTEGPKADLESGSKQIEELRTQLNGLDIMLAAVLSIGRSIELATQTYHHEYLAASAGHRRPGADFDKVIELYDAAEAYESSPFLRVLTAMEFFDRDDGEKDKGAETDSIKEAQRIARIMLTIPLADELPILEPQ